MSEDSNLAVTRVKSTREENHPSSAKLTIKGVKSAEAKIVDSETRAKLLVKLKTLPAAPGVYFHKDLDGNVIYVGKAAVLKNRVRQYFHNTNKDPKTEALVREIADTDWVVVDTEMDALFLE